MATVTFFIRTTKKTDPNKKINIRVRFRHGKTVNIYAKSGLQVLPHHFSNETHTINKRAKYEDKQADKQYLENLEREILKSYKNLKDIPTPEWLNNIIDKYRFPDKYRKKPLTLFEFIKNFVENAPNRTTTKNNNTIYVSKGTIKEYKQAFNRLKEYSESIGKEIDFKDIDLNFYNDYVKYLKGRGYSLNTVGKNIKILKIFMREATETGLNTNLIYTSKNFRVLKEESENIYLSEAELDKIYKLDLSNKPHLERVRDMFLVGCWTGLRFSDWQKVTKENIENGILTVKQQKTGGEVNIPIIPIVQEILDKYEGKMPKAITNQKFNIYIKEVVKLADLKKAITKQITKGNKAVTEIKPKWQMVSTHTARRSFATNMYNLGLSPSEIMPITGQKTEKEFFKYIKITPKENAKRVRDKIMKLSNHLKVAK